MIPEHPPRFKPSGVLKATTDTGTKLAGQYGRCQDRPGVCYASRRDSGRHRLKALNAYAISTEVLKMLFALDCQKVFIVETDTGDVLEYEYEDFTDWGEPVPEKYLQDAGDPQRYAKVDDPLARWPDHAGAFWDRTADEDAPEPAFQRASEVDS